jgi:hypothetical protein
MSGRKRIRDGLKETVDEAVRLIDKGADRAGELIDRGMRKVEEGARQEGRLMPPAPPRRKPTVEDVVDDTAVALGRAGKKVATVADRGIRRVGRAVDSDPDLRHVVDRGVQAMDRVVEKGVEIARKGIRKTEEIIDDRKKRRER